MTEYRTRNLEVPRSSFTKNTWLIVEVLFGKTVLSPNLVLVNLSTHNSINMPCWSVGRAVVQSVSQSVIQSINRIEW